MPGPKPLFEQPAAELKFGVDPSSHVAHFITKADGKDFKTIGDKDPQKYYSGYGTVHMEELYDNAGEHSTEKFFRKMAIQAEKDYKDLHTDQEMRNILICLKDYMTAKSRDGQQGSLVALQIKMLAYHDKLIKDSEKLNPQQKIANSAKLSQLNWYASEFSKQLYGDLQIPEEEQQKLDAQKNIKEPSDVFLGKVGIWQESSKSLFPHDPSPNDVKQGVGVQDCYVLSTISTVAAKHPEQIKNMMKDNGDGTVTVRFYYQEDNKPEKTPVFIKVNKTVNQTVFGHNVYSSSSLWVQMLEKAYAVYNAQYGRHLMSNMGKKMDGMNSIWRGASHDFMDAISEVDYSTERYTLASQLYEHDENGKMINHPDYYLDEEKQIYNILDDYINKDGEPVVVGCHPSKDLDPKNFGIRTGHAYAVNKVFEKDGKKFVQLRDPYASFQARYESEGVLDDNWLKHDAMAMGATFTAGNQTMGTFNLELKDYLNIFDDYTCAPIGMTKELGIMKKTARDYGKYPLTPGELVDEKAYRMIMDNRAPKEESVEDVVKLDDEKLGKKHAAPENEEIIEDDDGFEMEGKPGVAEIEPEKEEDMFVVEYTPTQQLARMLDQPKIVDQLADRVSKALNDLNATDEWFVWTNTQKFKDMKKSLEVLNKSIKALQKDPKAAEKYETIYDITLKLEDTRQKADDYIESKSKSISDNYAKGKSPSLRAIHRFTGAVNIRNICSFEEPLTVWPGKDKEAMSVVREDIMQRLDMFEKGEKIPHDDKTVEQTRKALDQINTVIEKNPKLKSEAQKRTEEVQKVMKEYNMSAGDDF